jgi:two-component system nitrate/nitrite response regulator NarL
MLNDSAVRVLVVDDHAAVRAGISNLIDAERPRLMAVGTAASADEALDQAHSLQPDVVVLDVNLGGEDGLALIPALRHTAACEVVVLSSLLDQQLATHARRLGAHACLHKTAPANELIECIASARIAGSAPLGTARRRAECDVRAGTPEISGVGPKDLNLLRDNDGVTAIEYGLLAGLIAIAIIVGLTTTSESISAVFEYWSSAVLNALQ